MFYLSADGYNYQHPINDPQGQNAYLPLEIDTEYTHPKWNIHNPSKVVCINLTVQMRAIGMDVGLTYDHPENPLKRRYKPLMTCFAPIDYLRDNGYSVELSRPSKINNAIDLPWIQVDLFAFFALAELLRVVEGKYRTDILSFITTSNNEGIEQGRRLRTFTKAGNQYLNWIELPWLLKVNGYEYRVRCCIHDTCAVQGVSSYASFCANSNIILPYKDNFNPEEKSRMDDMYIERPDDFRDYALGDLYNYPALQNHAQQFKDIYEELGVEKYYESPRLTVGATVCKLIEATLLQIFKADKGDRNPINAFCKPASADSLKRITRTTAWMNAKVDGGRCRNNRPTTTTIKGVLCDIDISSCYGEGLRSQIYPMGIPVIIDYPMNTPNNQYETLKSFLGKYRRKLVPGLWQARVSLREGYKLENSQDFFSSWFPPNDPTKMPTDSDFSETDQWWEVENVGDIKILNNEITHAILTHDGLQWIENIAGKRLKTELLNNLVVETAMYYPNCERVNSVDELLEAHKSHNGRNTCEVKVKNTRSRKISIEQECHRWIGVNFGDLLIDKLLLKRRQYPKENPMNTKYKLCVNTVYGDMVSPFFTIGNVVVGNNITARARALVWYMEKGFHGMQTITDGCVFDLNRVLYPRDNRKINGSMVVNLYADNKLSHHTFKPLSYNDDLSVTVKSYELGYDNTGRIDLLADFGDDVEPEFIDEPIKWINERAMVHLRNLFPEVDVLHGLSKDLYGNLRQGLFEFEAKGFFNSGSFHGSANYSLQAKYKPTKYAMRSYSKNGCKSIDSSSENPNDLYIDSEDEKPSENFLNQLYNPERLTRSPVYIKSRILKIGDYRKNIRKWRDSNVYPGCTVESAALLHEFSLSQFTFKTYDQYKGWRREYESLGRRYNQSYEMFFLNEDGTLNYQLMIETIDAAIRNGDKCLFDGLDKHQANLYRKYIQHCNGDKLELTNRQLEIRYYPDGEEFILKGQNVDTAMN
ncbi:hypothetical protein [Calothrix sp. 336/3]|uniref:hypothetical protein n=1 Tax=Calothrix sp. 336/3 TaxID=1337936 RepID=UPI0004E3556B|nr:hypothetical protein [Calothrix sp. 336/3]AKG24955.1 hypothetical protein IJ00_26830 [Calothrix sp. 336/3]